MIHFALESQGKVRENEFCTVVETTCLDLLGGEDHVRVACRAM